jgi:hypothetical protein
VNDDLNRIIDIWQSRCCWLPWQPLLQPTTQRMSLPERSSYVFTNLLVPPRRRENSRA